MYVLWVDWYLGSGGEGGRSHTWGCRDQIGFKADDRGHIGISTVDTIRGGVHNTIYRELETTVIEIMQECEELMSGMDGNVRI